jgi:hypothetical protein
MIIKKDFLGGFTALQRLFIRCSGPIPNLIEQIFALFSSPHYGKILRMAPAKEHNESKQKEISPLDLLLPTLNIAGALVSVVTKSYQDKKTYEEKLENATGTDVYKYVLLINVAALGGYVLLARLQAQQSFNLSKRVAVAGFGIIAIAICLSVFLTISGNQNLNAAYLTGIAGVLTEFTSGVFFFLYSKTLTQINLFHDKLVDMQKTALSHLSDKFG